MCILGGHQRNNLAPPFGCHVFGVKQGGITHLENLSPFTRRHFLKKKKKNKDI